MAGPASVDEYLSGVADEPRAALERLRSLVREVVPEAVEAISYQIPTMKYRGRALVGFAAFKDHCSLFPYDSQLVAVFGSELTGYTTSKGTIRFPLERPLPAALVKKIVQARVRAIDERLG